MPDNSSGDPCMTVVDGRLHFSVNRLFPPPSAWAQPQTIIHPSVHPTRASCLPRPTHRHATLLRLPYSVHAWVHSLYGLL